MTHVLLGEDLVTREPVAIKVLDMTFLGRPEVVERFTREAERAAEGRSPRTWYDRGQQGREPTGSRFMCWSTCKESRWTYCCNASGCCIRSWR
jgi:hypothetical protein